MNTLTTLLNCDTALPPQPSSKEELSSVVSRIMKTLQRGSGLLKRLFQKKRSNMSLNSFQELSAGVIM
jgi:hypothetical protein